MYINRYWGASFPRDKVSRGIKLTTQLHIVPWSRLVELYLHSPIYLHVIVLNYLKFYLTCIKCMCIV
jgi:hypothetical protein